MLPLPRAPECGRVAKLERARTRACKGGNSCGQGQVGGRRAWRGSSWALKGLTSWQCACFLGGRSGWALVWCRTHPLAICQAPHQPLELSSTQPWGLPSSGFEWVGFKGSPHTPATHSLLPLRNQWTWEPHLLSLALFL